MEKKGNSREEEKTVFQIAGWLAFVIKRKSRRRFLQTPGKDTYDNVTAFFLYFTSSKYWVGRGGGSIWWLKNGLIKSQNMTSGTSLPD